MKRAHERLQHTNAGDPLSHALASRQKAKGQHKQARGQQATASDCLPRIKEADSCIWDGANEELVPKQHNAMRPLTTAGPGCMMQCARANTWASRGPSPFRRFFLFAMNSWIQFAAHPCGDLPHRMHWLATTAKLSTDLLNPSVAWLWLHHRLGQACPSNVCVQRLKTAAWETADLPLPLGRRLGRLLVRIRPLLTLSFAKVALEACCGCDILTRNAMQGGKWTSTHPFPNPSACLQMVIY